MTEEYTFEEVVKASKEYFDGDMIATDIYVKKYAMKNNNGKYIDKTPADTYKRLAKAFAR